MSELREALESAYDEHENKLADAETGNANDPADEPDDNDLEGELSGDTGKPESEGRKRGEDGKFFKDEKAPDAGASQKPKKDELEADIKPPMGWDKLEEWKNLPKSVKERIVQREADVEKGFTKIDNERQFAKSVRDIVNPYMPIIQAEGGTPEGAIKDLLNTAYVLRTADPQTKANLLLNIARTYNVDMQAFSGAMQNNQPINPQITQLQQELMRVKQQMSERERLQAEQEQANINSQVQAFASDPANLYFDKVRDVMGALLESGKAKDLKEAYETAIWSDPEIRSTLLAKQAEEEKAKRKAEVEAKKKAASSVTGSPDPRGNSSKPPERSLREELEASYDDISGSRV